MTETARELFDLHHVDVYRYLLRMVRRPDVAEDLTQEVFLKVVQGLTNYDERGKALGWVFTIARNVLTDHLHHQDPLHLSLDEAELLAGGNHVAAFGFNEALALVPPVEREAFLLHEQVGLTYLEIASVCDVTWETVNARIYRARRNMRQLLSSRLSGDRPDARRREP